MNLFRDGCRNDDVGFVLVAETFNVLIENFGCTDNREPCFACVPCDSAASVGVWLVTGKNVFPLKLFRGRAGNYAEPLAY